MKHNKISKNKSFVLMALIFSDIVLFTYININVPLANFLMMLVILLLITIFYRKSILDAFLGFGLTYFLITITSYFPFILYQQYFSKLNLNISSELSICLFLYIPVFSLYPLFYRLRGYIFNVGMFFRELKHSLTIVQLINYSLLFLNTLFMEWISHNMNPMFKATLYASVFIAFVYTAIYFARINDKAKEVEMLNNALVDKITELKKIKHDYGSEISGLYGLYQLGKMDRLGELLRNIVERNQILNTAVNVNIKANPLITSVLNMATAKNINIIVFDSGDYENLSITEGELLKVLSNIIKNSIEVLECAENPTIKYKSYNNYNGITITITNNGPKIPESIRDRIFQSGFSTKENKTGDRGFGLCIVKDIINKCNGRITVESNEMWTQFNINIPYETSRSSKVNFNNLGGLVFEECNKENCN
jgi:signal transduction histidine kinase